MNAVAIKQFNRSLTSPDMVNHLGKLLPPGVGVDRFTRTTMVAIQNNPGVLEADRQSLYNAISRAAQDGLLPDGREAALIVYNTKAGKLVRYGQMVEGVIKQLGKAGIHAYAASVYSNETVEIWNDDRGQHVTHKPVPFGDRGQLVGVFASARIGEQTYVETMNIDEIDKVRASSRSGENGPWKVWYDRMAQKSVLHRLKKRLPILDPAVSDSLRALDEENEDAQIIDIEEAAPTEQVQPEQHEETDRPKGLQAVMDSDIDGEDLF